MRRIIIVFCLLAMGLKGFTQQTPSVLRDTLMPELKVRLSEIDDYVKSVDNNKKLVRDAKTSEYTDGRIGEEFAYYADSTRKTILKLEVLLPSKYNLYYKHGKLIYSEDISPASTNNGTNTYFIAKEYFDNDKVIFKSITPIRAADNKTQ